MAKRSREEINKLRQIRRAERDSSGLCLECGCSRDNLPAKVCKYCTSLIVKRNKRYRNKLTICPKCGHKF